MSSLTLEDIDSVSEVAAGGAAQRMLPMSAPAQHLPPHHLHMNNIPSAPLGATAMPTNNLGPLPPSSWSQTYNSNPYGPSFNPMPALGQVKNYTRPAPYLNDTSSYVSMPGNCAESVHSGSGKSAAIVMHFSAVNARYLSSFLPVVSVLLLA